MEIFKKSLDIHQTLKKQWSLSVLFFQIFQIFGMVSIRVVTHLVLHRNDILKIFFKIILWDFLHLRLENELFLIYLVGHLKFFLVDGIEGQKVVDFLNQRLPKFLNLYFGNLFNRIYSKKYWNLLFGWAAS